MFKYIKLTETSGNAATIDIHINALYIASFKVGKKGVDTMVTMSDGKWLFVKETPNQIRKLIDE